MTQDNVRLSFRRTADECAERILLYFDDYKLGSVAPIVIEIEQAIEVAYERGREQGFTDSKLPPDGLSHTGENYAMSYGLDGESDEARAFRRFPIDRHKQG